MKVNYLDLFSGIAGMALGFNMAGIEFQEHYYSEVEDYAIKVYEKHYPKAKGLGDITKITGEGLERINLISAGFPCQDISVAGKQTGLEGSRSGLFYEIIRLAEALSPDIIFLENVANLLGSNKGRDMGTVLGELAEIGYDAEWDCIPASYVGAYHRRDRVWITAYPNSSRLVHRQNEKFPTKGRKPTQRELGSSCSYVADSKCFGRSTGSNNKHKHKIYKEREQDKKVVKCRERLWFEFGKRSSNKFTRKWSPEPGVGRVANGIPNRVDRLKCLGNAVVPQVVEYVARIKIMPILEVVM